VSVGPANRPRRNRTQKRSGRMGSNAERPPRTATRGCSPQPIGSAGARAELDEQVWVSTMTGLRRIIFLLSAALVAGIARLVIDGPKLLGDLTGALLAVLLLCSLALRRRGLRLRPSASSETERVDAR